MKTDKPQITIHIEVINKTKTKATTEADIKIHRKVNVLTTKFIKQLENVLKEFEKPTPTKKKK